MYFPIPGTDLARYRSIIKELELDANNAAIRLETLALEQARRRAAEDSAKREGDRAEQLAAELGQLRAAAPPPEAADVAELRASLEFARRELIGQTARAERAEHEARVWASGKGNVETIHSYALASQGKALDATLRREGEALRKLRTAEAALAAARTNAGAEIAALREQLAGAVLCAEVAERVIGEKNALLGERLTEIAHLRKELDAAERATAPEEDPGAPLTVNCQLVVSSRPNGHRYVSVHRDGEQILSALVLDDEEEGHLREMVRAYNILNHDEGTDADKVVDRAIRAWGEKEDLALARAIGTRYAGCFEKKGDDGGLLENLASSIALNEIKRARGTLTPAASVGEAVDRAIDGARPERWDRVVGKAIGPEVEELPGRAPLTPREEVLYCCLMIATARLNSHWAQGDAPKTVTRFQILAELHPEATEKPHDREPDGAIAAEWARLRGASLAIPSFRDGARWMWRRLTGRVGGGA